MRCLLGNALLRQAEVKIGSGKIEVTKQPKHDELSDEVNLFDLKTEVATTLKQMVL